MLLRGGLTCFNYRTHIFSPLSVSACIISHPMIYIYNLLYVMSAALTLAGVATSVCSSSLVVKSCEKVWAPQFLLFHSSLLFFLPQLSKTNFSNNNDFRSFLKSLCATFKEFKMHEQIENEYIIGQLQQRCCTVYNVHSDNKLSEMLSLFEKGLHNVKVNMPKTYISFMHSMQLNNPFSKCMHAPADPQCVVICY